MKLLIIGADWCESCRNQDEEFKHQPLIGNIPIEHLDADDLEIVCKYDVGEIPTLILIDKQEEVYRWVDETPSRIINQKIEELCGEK